MAPPVRPTDKPEILQAEKTRLDNGIPVYSLRAGTQDVCKIDFIFEAGSWQQTNQLEAALCNAMLQEGSRLYSAPRIAEIFDFHGAYLQLSANQHDGLISIICLTRHLPELMPVIAPSIMLCRSNSAFYSKTKK